MDGNKDDAIKLLNIGKEALKSGCNVRALKFFNKARRVDPSLKDVEGLIAAANKDPSDSGTSPAAAESAAPPSELPNGGPSLRSRNPSAKGSDISSGLEKGCSVEDVRKAYRKLSLKVHPDKNKAPGAEEAFKAVSKAFQCLSNEEGRKKYDFTGSEEASFERPRDGRHGFNGFYDGVEVDADEIFRNFFFGSMAPTRTGYGGFRFRTGAGPNVQTAEFNGVGNGNLRVIFQILPILLLLLVNFFPSSEPAYSLNRGYPYDRRVLTGRGVPYYVKNSRFEQDYPYQSEKRVALENRVEREFFSIASENCRMERHRQHWGLSQKTPHCDLLKLHGVDSY